MGVTTKAATAEIEREAMVAEDLIGTMNAVARGGRLAGDLTADAAKKARKEIGVAGDAVEKFGKKLKGIGGDLGKFAFGLGVGLVVDKVSDFLFSGGNEEFQNWIDSVGAGWLKSEKAAAALAEQVKKNIALQNELTARFSDRDEVAKYRHDIELVTAAWLSGQISADEYRRSIVGLHKDLKKAQADLGTFMLGPGTEAMVGGATGAIEASVAAGKKQADQA